jgi:hypothetical protein
MEPSGNIQIPKNSLSEVQIEIYQVARWWKLKPEYLSYLSFPDFQDLQEYMFIQLEIESQLNNPKKNTEEEVWTGRLSPKEYYNGCRKCVSGKI